MSGDGEKLRPKRADRAQAGGFGLRVDVGLVAGAIVPPAKTAIRGGAGRGAELGLDPVPAGQFSEHGRAAHQCFAAIGSRRAALGGGLLLMVVAAALRRRPGRATVEIPSGRQTKISTPSTAI